MSDADKNDNLLQGLIKETLRLYPVAPFIGRYAAHDGQLGGCEIKKNVSLRHLLCLHDFNARLTFVIFFKTLVLLSLYTAGREQQHFVRPLEVLPERWHRSEAVENALLPHEPHASLPFAIGIRSCIGKKIAINQISALLGTVSI